MDEEGADDSQIDEGMWIAPVRYAPGPSGSIDSCIVRSRWKGRCNTSSGCNSGTGEMSDPEKDIDLEVSIGARELGLADLNEAAIGGARFSEGMREWR